MQFNHTWELVLSGAKTQTRRIVKPGEEAMIGFGRIAAVFTVNKKLVYGVGQSVAVQPGRGKKAVGRIEITGIRREDVREISDEDAKAEGFYNAFDFLRTWVAMYDKTREFYEREGTTGLWCFYDGKPRGWITETRDGLMDMLHSRPAERYQAWVLEFRLVETS